MESVIERAHPHAVMGNFVYDYVNEIYEKFRKRKEDLI